MSYIVAVQKKRNGIRLHRIWLWALPVAPWVSWHWLQHWENVIPFLGEPGPGPRPSFRLRPRPRSGPRPPRLQGARAGLKLARPSPPPPPPPEGNRLPRLLGPAASVVVMEYPWDDLTLAFSRTSMFPFFDIAHYLVSVMALKQRPGEWRGPTRSRFRVLTAGGRDAGMPCGPPLSTEHGTQT